MRSGLRQAAVHVPVSATSRAGRAREQAVIDLLTPADREQIAEILSRRANEIAGFSGDYRNDPKHFVTNRFGRTHDVNNLYVCDASVFPSPTDKSTTISIIAFTLRTCEHMLDNFRNGLHRRA